MAPGGFVGIQSVMHVNFRRLLPSDPHRGTKCHVGQESSTALRLDLSSVALRVQGALQMSHPAGASCGVTDTCLCFLALSLV